MINRQKILGIDYGDKRVGLALSEGNLPLPYKVLKNLGPENLLSELKKIIQEENISLVVVGLPRSLSGRDNQRLQITQVFVDFLKQNLKAAVDTVDEQMTTKLYDKMGVTRDIDKHAATAILETYLAKRHE